MACTQLLARLGDDCTDITAAAVNPAEFSVGHRGPVHNDGGDSPHAVVALAAGLALDQPGKKFSCVKWHTSPPVFPGTDSVYAPQTAGVHEKKKQNRLLLS